MRLSFVLLLIVIFAKCESTQQAEDKTLANDTIIHYSEDQLISFLDSIGKLSSSELVKSTWHYPDSLFKNRESFNHKISVEDFEALKKSAKTNAINIKAAKRIFVNWNVDSSFIDGNLLHIEYIQLSKKKFKDYAICIGPSSGLVWENTIYFFNQNNVISKHKIQHRYGLEISCFVDIDGRTTVYYKENYTSGSGIWWFNYYFYKYLDNKLIPVLNELENSNLSSPWGLHAIWFESKIQSTNPLIMNLVYNNAINDSSYNSVEIVNDSTMVEYHWDEASKSLIGDYANSKLTKEQIYSYYLDGNELLYINSHYKILKLALNNIEESKKRIILYYLNEVKNSNRKKSN